MTREHLMFVAGMLVVLVPVLAYVALKKTGLLNPARPDSAVVYKAVDGRRLELKIFKAKRRKNGEATPAMLFYHGGAWQYGNPAQFYRQCKVLSALGLTCISAQYRIESQHGTDPRAAVNDARDAFRYLVENAQALGVDARRIVVGGGSAGGHLAAAVGVPLPLPRDGDVLAPFDQRPAAMILYNPMLDLSPCKPDHHLVTDYWHEVSPMHHVDDRTPPALSLSGTEDPEVPVPTAQAFCAAMQAKGGRCELELYEGARHGFFNPSVEQGKYFDATNARVIEFLQGLGIVDGDERG